MIAPGNEQATVSVGPGVHLVFSERQDLTEADLQRMRGVHICIYVAAFQSLYERLSARGLIWTNPRFTHLDSCDSWDEAQASRTLRFKHLVNGDKSETLYEMEHETRSLRHGQFLKVPAYDPK